MIRGLNKNHAILAKCLNYFFEINPKQKDSGDGIVIGIRTIGLILFVIAHIKIGFVLLKEAKEYKV